MGLEDRFSFFMDMTKYHLTLVFHFIHSTHFMSSTTLNFYQPSSSMPEGFKTQWGQAYVYGVRNMSPLIEIGHREGHPYIRSKPNMTSIS